MIMSDDGYAPIRQTLLTVLNARALSLIARGYREDEAYEKTLDEAGFSLVDDDDDGDTVKYVNDAMEYVYLTKMFGSHYLYLDTLQ